MPGKKATVGYVVLNTWNNGHESKVVPIEPESGCFEGRYHTIDLKEAAKVKETAENEERERNPEFADDGVKYIVCRLEPV